MSVSRDVIASWARPRAVLRRLHAAGPREDRALAFLLIACTLIFVSGLPRLAQLAQADASVPLAARMGAAMLAWMGLMPLALYGLAALSHLLARPFGGRGGYHGARLALFWALLAAAPAWLAQAAWAALAPGPAARLAAALALALTLWIWLSGLIEVEWGKADEAG